MQFIKAIKKNWGIGALLLSVVLFQSCSQSTGPFPPPYSITINRAPQTINLIGQTTYRFEALVTHPVGLEAVEAVQLKFFLPSQPDSAVLSFPMVDDGGVLFPDAGDIVARDGIFTRVIDPRTTDLTALSDSLVFFRMEVRDERGNTKQSVLDTVHIIKSKPPQLLSVITPDTIPSGVAQFSYVATVADSDGFEDVRFVLAEGWRDNQKFFTDTLAIARVATQTFTFTGDSTYAAEKSGTYELRFFAVDRSGNLSNTLSKDIYIENTPPVVLETAMVDSVTLPPAGQQYLIPIFARVSDSQGLGDIDQVSFTVTLEEGNEGNPIEMFDNGDVNNSGDQTAGDGIYTRIVTLNSNNTPGRYIFKFLARDRTGQQSTPVLDTLVIVANE